MYSALYTIRKLIHCSKIAQAYMARFRKTV